MNYLFCLLVRARLSPEQIYRATNFSSHSFIPFYVQRRNSDAVGSLLPKSKVGTLGHLSVFFFLCFSRLNPSLWFSQCFTIHHKRIDMFSGTQNVCTVTELSATQTLAARSVVVVAVRVAWQNMFISFSRVKFRCDFLLVITRCAVLVSGALWVVTYDGDISVFIHTR